MKEEVPFGTSFCFYEEYTNFMQDWLIGQKVCVKTLITLDIY